MVELYVWGHAASGQLAVGETDDDVKLPTQVPYYEGFTSKVVDIACGSQHTVFLTDEGMVYTCGNNDFGQLGHGKVCSKPGIQKCTEMLLPILELFKFYLCTVTVLIQLHSIMLFLMH
jgi:E3 ubiquitin-protein ligase HERC4